VFTAWHEPESLILVMNPTARQSSEVVRKAAAMLPVLAVSGGDIWAMSAPFGRSGFFYQGWVERGPDWRRIKVPATECPRILPLTARNRTTKGDRWFRQEYMRNSPKIRKISSLSS
jgi:hypothetical protein